MPVIPAQMCVGQGDVTDVRVRPGGEWVSAVMSEFVDGRKTSRLAMWSRDGSMHNLLASPEPGSGFGLSGGIHCWSRDGNMVFVALRSGGVCALNVDSGLHTMLAFDQSKVWSALAPNHDDSLIVATSMWKDVCIATVDGKSSRSVSHGFDFAIDPVWWLNEAVWCAWSRPHMPWDFTELRSESGIVVSYPDAQVQQPRVSPDGSHLGFLTDVSGVLTLWVTSASGVHTHVVDDSCEHGDPTWGPGQRTWCWSPDSQHIAFTRNLDGYATVNVVDLSTRQVSTIGRAVHGCLDWSGDTLAAIRTGARTPPEVIRYDMAMTEPQSEPSRRRVISAAAPEWNNEPIREELVEPEVRHVGGVPVRLYRSRFSAGSLLCCAHGGPTDQWKVTFMPRLVYWLSRGVDVAVVDYRGSTGHGRAYQQMLNGAWGMADVEDLLTVAAHAHASWSYTPHNTAFMGGSAGGLTVLGALAAQPGIAACGLVSYPVTDLALLAAGDDEFEAHCVPRLVGADRRGVAAYDEASPLRRAAQLARTPVLSFHGDKDTNVPIEHSYRLRNEVVKHGGTFVVEVMEGEGHGFRNRDNQLKEYRLSEEFLKTYLEMR